MHSPELAPNQLEQSKRLDQLGRRELNALRRLFDRPVVKPADVAALGRHRLDSIPGLGIKGQARVLAWLAAHGYPQDDSHTPGTAPPAPHAARHTGQSRQLLEQWGWQISTPGNTLDTSRLPPSISPSISPSSPPKRT